MITCNNCDRENEEEFNFCLGCGSPLTTPEKKAEPAAPEMIDCPHCSAKVPGGFKFCGACGGSLAQPSAGPSSPVQAGGPVHRDEEKAQPRPQTLGELTVIQPDGSEGARIPITSEGVVLGRNSDVPVLSSDPFLSPRHAEVNYQDGKLLLRDLDSVNGIFWRLREEVQLTDGDMIRLGQELLKFQLFDQVQPLVQRPVETDTALQGSPADDIWGRLSLIGGPNVETRAFVLSGHESTIGREIGSVLFRDDGFVSGKHARIYRDGERVFLRDLGSSNGSYIRIREVRELISGDLILMGQQLFRINLT